MRVGAEKLVTVFFSFVYMQSARSKSYTTTPEWPRTGAQAVNTHAAGLLLSCNNVIKVVLTAILTVGRVLGVQLRCLHPRQLLSVKVQAVTVSTRALRSADDGGHSLIVWLRHFPSISRTLLTKMIHTRFKFINTFA